MELMFEVSTLSERETKIKLFCKKTEFWAIWAEFAGGKTGREGGRKCVRWRVVARGSRKIGEYGSAAGGTRRGADRKEAGNKKKELANKSPNGAWQFGLFGEGGFCARTKPAGVQKRAVRYVQCAMWFGAVAGYFLGKKLAAQPPPRAHLILSVSVFFTSRFSMR